MKTVGGPKISSHYNLDFNSISHMFELLTAHKLEHLLLVKYKKVNDASISFLSLKILLKWQNLYLKLPFKSKLLYARLHLIAEICSNSKILPKMF